MNKKYDKNKNNNDFAHAAKVCDANFFEIDAKYLDFIGGGTSGQIESPVING